MKHSEIRAHWDNEVIPKARTMREKGKSFKEVAEALGVNYGTLKYHLDRMSNVALARTQQKKAEANTLKYFECLAMRDKGMSLEEIGTELNFSRERARQILKNFGVAGRINESPYYRVSSEEMLKKDISKKRKAFRLGLTIAEYETYIQKVPKEIRVHLRAKITDSDRNTNLVKLLEDGVPLMQLTVLELVGLYIQKAKELNPECEVWPHVRMMLSSGSGYMVVRKDFSLPLTITNCFLSTKTEFGVIIGKKFGTHSDYQKLIGVCV